MGLQLSHQVSLQGSEFLGRATRNWFDVHCSGFPSLLQVAFDRGPGHAEQLDDVITLVSLIDCSKHPFSQILRIGFHWLPPFGACLLLSSPFILSLGSRFLPTAVVRKRFWLPSNAHARSSPFRSWGLIPIT